MVVLVPKGAGYVEWSNRFGVAEVPIVMIAE